MTTRKTITLTIWTFVGKVISLFFNILSTLFVMAFLPRSKHLLISWLQSPSTVIFGAQENKVCYCFHFLPFFLPSSDGTRCHDLSFWMLSFKPTFSLSSFFFFVRSHEIFLCEITWCSLVAQICNAGDLGSIPELGRSPGEGNGNPLQYSCLENSMDEAPTGLQSMGLQRVGHDWATSPSPSSSFIKRLFSSSSLSAIRVISSAYLRLLLFLPAILIPACASFSLAFHMMYSA